MRTPHLGLLALPFLLLAALVACSAMADDPSQETAKSDNEHDGLHDPAAGHGMAVRIGDRSRDCAGDRLLSREGRGQGNGKN